MDELQTINDIVNDAVKDSSYTTVIISSCVFIIYILIINLVDLRKSKDKSKPLLEMASAIKDINENATRLSQILDKIIQDAEQKEYDRISNIIVTSLFSFKAAVLDRCIDIIIHNNIEKSRDDIIQNVYKTINTEYYKLYCILATYEHDNIPVSTKLKKEWVDDITEECVAVIYDGADSITRVRQLNNKLTIIAEECSIYIKNKILNH